ncbi:WXG100 family type VII secretion target [Nocardia sp. NEAU-G5]|uniref:WXG100 family type VII secretion target n=1 Tax=Nocardia albiluteola TaxID=2842303 RepID=A0ABS6B8T7_9NOCA|nr:WXG100 family type VII secretion target [Nocardia albiluteola]MBU3066151.1 WXG100 family type VII secretion target [Nocardia albiluteola]
MPTAVSDAGKFTQDTATALRNGIRSTDTEIQALMTTWKGTAAAYLAGWEETKRGALEVLEALAGMADALGVTAVGFADIDDRRATDTARVTSSLNLP